VRTIKSILSKPFGFQIDADGFEIGIFWLSLLLATSPMAFVVYLVLVSIYTEEEA
jgi:hypothetical protein